MVATEVRALAKRAGDAARDIKVLISESSKQVDNGVGLVQKAGESLVRIVESVATIRTSVDEISVAAQGQADRLQQVNGAIIDMDQVTQQNAAMVEQSTAASRGLTEEAKHLTRLVDQFQLLDTTKDSPPTRGNVQPIRPAAERTPRVIAGHAEGADVIS